MSTPIPFSYDAQHQFGTDVNISNTGDLALTTKENLSTQRVTQRLMTVPGVYLFHPTFGAGYPAFVGQPLTPVTSNKIKSTTLTQIFEESTVAKSPTPTTITQTIQNGFYAQVNYTYGPTNQPLVLSFGVS